MRKNSFLNHLSPAAKRVVAVEMEANDPIKPIGPAVVANVDQIPAEKAGFTSDKKPEDQNLEISKEVKIGDEPDFDKKQEDYVAQGQEDGLALEHISNRIRAHQLRGWGLEDIAEIAQSTLDGEPAAEPQMASAPVEPGISPEAALMVQRALDMGEIVEDNEVTSVAIESFDFSRVAATESFTDRLMGKATQNGNTAGKYANSMVSRLQNAAQRIGSRMGEVYKAMDTVAKDLKDVNAGNVHLDPAAVQRISKRVMADANARDPFDALRKSNELFREVLGMAKVQYTAAVKKIQNAVNRGDEQEVIQATNEALALAKKFADMSKTPYADASFEVSVPTVSGDTKASSIRVTEIDSPKSTFSVTDLRGITASEARQAADIVDDADAAIKDRELPRSIGNQLLTALPYVGSVIHAVTKNVQKSEMEQKRKLATPTFAGNSTRNANRVAARVVSELHDAVWGTVYNFGDAVIVNGTAVRQWGVETLSVGRKARGDAKPE